jgi:gamma-glutamyl:cysteine ligase YbdK (ATP-grasp superfamily)
MIPPLDTTLPKALSPTLTEFAGSDRGLATGLSHRRERANRAPRGRTLSLYEEVIAPIVEFALSWRIEFAIRVYGSGSASRRIRVRETLHRARELLKNVAQRLHIWKEAINSDWRGSGERIVECRVSSGVIGRLVTVPRQK